MARKLSEQEVLRAAEDAKLIVCGYAFTALEDGLVRILDLKHPDCFMIVNSEAEIFETNMAPIEQRIVLELCRRNLQFMDV